MPGAQFVQRRFGHSSPLLSIIQLVHSFAVSRYALVSLLLLQGVKIRRALLELKKVQCWATGRREDRGHSKGKTGGIQKMEEDRVHMGEDRRRSEENRRRVMLTTSPNLCWKKGKWNLLNLSKTLTSPIEM